MDTDTHRNDDIYMTDGLDLVNNDVHIRNVEWNDIKHNHDTIGMVVMDSKGNLAGGTSTNGANHKIPG